jgi:hypothetical protein
LAGNNEKSGSGGKDVKHHPALLNILVQELGCKGNKKINK